MLRIPVIKPPWMSISSLAKPGFQIQLNPTGIPRQAAQARFELAGIEDRARRATNFASAVRQAESGAALRGNLLLLTPATHYSAFPRTPWAPPAKDDLSRIVNAIPDRLDQAARANIAAQLDSLATSAKSEAAAVVENLPEFLRFYALR
jgi:hypothetical protein